MEIVTSTIRVSGADRSTRFRFGDQTFEKTEVCVDSNVLVTHLNSAPDAAPEQSHLCRQRERKRWPLPVSFFGHNFNRNRRDALNRSSNERSTAPTISSFDRLCETVIRDV